MFLRKRFLVKFDGKENFLLMSSETGSRTLIYIFRTYQMHYIQIEFELTTTVKVSDE